MQARPLSDPFPAQVWATIWDLCDAQADPSSVQEARRSPQEKPKMPQNCPKKASALIPGISKMVLLPRRQAFFVEVAQLCSFLVFPIFPGPFEAQPGFKMALGWPEDAPR